jgi:hypothetical protein
MSTDRKAYMREYMRNRRKQAKAVDVNNPANRGLTEERLRAIVREEIEQAIGPLRELLTRLTVNRVNTPTEPAEVNPADPVPYWKPAPDQPRDPRCQAANLDGSRCKAKGEVLVKARDIHGRLGEFDACKRHQDTFKPHPGVMRREGEP